MHVPANVEDPDLDELLCRERHAADGLFSRLDSRGRGFLGASDVLEVLASGLLSGQPGVAKALAGAAVRTCGHLQRSDFLEAVVHETDQRSSVQHSFGPLSTKSEPLAQNLDLLATGGFVQGGAASRNDASCSIISGHRSDILSGTLDGSRPHTATWELGVPPSGAHSFSNGPACRGLAASSFESRARHISHSRDDIIDVPFSDNGPVRAAWFADPPVPAVASNSWSRWTAEFDASMNSGVRGVAEKHPGAPVSGVQLDYWAHSHFAKSLRGSRGHADVGGLELYLPRRALNPRSSRTPSPQPSTLPRQVQRAPPGQFEVRSATPRLRNRTRAASAGLSGRRAPLHVEACNRWEDELRGRPHQEAFRFFDCSLTPKLPLKIQSLSIRSPRPA